METHIHIPPTSRGLCLRLIMLMMAALLIPAFAPAAMAEEEGRWRLFPGGRLYEDYIADPRSYDFAIMRVFMTDTGIPDTGDNRYSFRIGGRHGLVRFNPMADPAENPMAGFQLDLAAAFIAQFDIDNSTDNIGWDGIYGVLLTWADGDGLALKLGIQHDSSHIGDEYMARAGRGRINYTREEITLGASWRGPENSPLSHWRFYGETGYGHVLRNQDLQEPWRLRGGVEYENRRAFWDKRAGYYAALDLESYEERDFQVDISTQAGLVLDLPWRFGAARIGLAWRRGRSIIGEFFQTDESSLTLGAWLDF